MHVPFNSRKQRLISVVLILLLALVGGASAYSVSVSSDTAQTLDGFGVSVAWSGGEILRLPADERERALRMFFTDEGAGVSIIRMRMVAKTDPDFAYQVEMALWAKAHGLGRFYATIWDVPSGFLDGNQKLLPERFDAFAGHIADYVRDMAAEGLPIGWIGVQNEPDNGPKLNGSWAVDYNKYTVHCYRSKAELRDFSVALKKLLASRGMSGVRLLGPECMGWEGTRELTKAQFETGDGRSALDVIGTHDYWGAERDTDMNPVRVEMAGQARANGKRIWQTEYSRFDCLPGCSDACQQPHVSQDPAKLESDGAFNMQDGLEMAEYVYRDLSLANASAWLFWWTHNPNKGCGTAGQIGMHNSFNGLAVLRSDNTFFFPKRFHALSHYMRFLKPGHVRLKLSTDGESVVHPLAFRDSAGAKVTVVLYNRGNAAAPVTLSLPGFATLNSVQPYLTTEAADQNVQAGTKAAFAAVPGFAMQLQPRAIVTLVFEKSATTSTRRRPSPAPHDPGAQGPVVLVRKKGRSDSRTLEGRRMPSRSRPDRD